MFLWYVDVGESFGVFEVDVVFGLMSFDEGAFKDDGFEFCISGYGFYCGGVFKHCLGFWVEWSFCEILFDAFF